MNEDSSSLAYGIAIGASTTLWLATAAIGGRSEPWDSSIYWSVSYPLAIVFAGFLGYSFPQRPWRWALAVMLTQAVVVLLGGSGLGMLPFGLIFLAVLSLPAIVLARLAARFRLRARDT